eukprot:COSAG02_NODE_7057_length_3205_cov_7.178686_6_plen_34_part_01
MYQSVANEFVACRRALLTERPRRRPAPRSARGGV